MYVVINTTTGYGQSYSTKLEAQQAAKRLNKLFNHWAMSRTKFIVKRAK